MFVENRPLPRHLRPVANQQKTRVRRGRVFLGSRVYCRERRILDLAHFPLQLLCDRQSKLPQIRDLDCDVV